MPATKTQTKKTTTVAKTGKSKKKNNGVPARTKIDMDQHLYISTARVAARFDREGMNKSITDAIEELKRAEPHTLENKETKEKTTTELVSLENVSESTRTLLEKATIRYNNTQTKRTESLEKRKVTLNNRWTATQESLTAQLASKKLSQKDHDSQWALAETKFNEDLKAVTTELSTPPQLINSKKLHHTVYEKEQAMIQKTRVRASKQVPVVIAAAANVWLNELIRHGMDNVVREEKSFLKCQHVLTDDVNTLGFLPFYRYLVTFQQGLRDEETRRRVETEKKSSKGKGKTKDAVVASADLVEEAEAEADVDDDGSDDESGDRKTVNFAHHVKQACLAVQNQIILEKGAKASKPYAGIRISEEFKVFCSNLISEFIGTLINLIQAELDCTHVTTVNPGHVFHVLKTFLMVFNSEHEPFVNLTNDIVERYEKFLETKKEEKASEAAVATVASS